MKILLIILLQYLALTNSLSFYNSHVFNSGAFNSGAFNSGSIKYCNSYFWYSTSQPQKSVFSYSNNQPTYLSYVVSNMQVSSLHNSFYLQSPSPMPSPQKSIFSYSNNQPTYLSYVVSNLQVSSLHNSFYLISSSQMPSPMPSPKPSQMPSPMPSPKPSQMPSPMPTLAISFGTKIAFSNYNSAELDTESQTAIVKATADSMSISSSFVKYTGTIVQTRRRLINHVYNIIVSLQTTIPLQGQFVHNPSALYLSLIANLEKSVDLGDFMKALPPSFANSTILSVENGKYVVIEPPMDKPGTDVHSIIYIVLFLLGILALVKIAYDVQTQKQWYQKSLLFLKEKSKKIKKRRDQKNRLMYNDISIDKLDYLYKFNNQTETTENIDCDPEELFCSISDLNNYDDKLQN